MAGRLKKGLVQVYTGNGKGKTSAALGLALRAAGAGLKVLICQFMKGRPSCETIALKKIGNITVRRCGRSCFVKRKPAAEDIGLAGSALAEVRIDIARGKYDVVILDEVNVASRRGLIGTDELIAVIKSRPSFVEVVLTGRSAPSSLMRCADLITEMREIRHPCRKGVTARRGIEY
jgi:cob(I)alamin adenosyltransferase